MALQLRSQGIIRVRPLAGGFDAWRSAGLPVEPIASAQELAAAAS